MAELPDVSLESAPAFLRAAGLEVDEATATRVTGTIAAAHAAGALQRAARA